MSNDIPIFESYDLGLCDDPKCQAVHVRFFIGDRCAGIAAINVDGFKRMQDLLYMKATEKC